MFERKKYKQFAKQQLKGRWTVPVLITILCTAIGVLFNIPGFLKSIQTGLFDSAVEIQTYGEFMNLYQAYTQSTSSTFSMIIRAIVDSILEVAGIKVYLQMSRSPEKVSFSSFIEGLNNWWRATLAGIWMFLWIFVWSLLFFIPGIIKSIAYSQTFYIISEYEDIPVTKAMRISILITKGHKADLFVTYLSFLGWMILAAIPFGIGFFWLEPYMNMTLINAYHSMLKEALESGLLKPEDLTK